MLINYKETLPGLPSQREVEHKIGIIVVIQKPLAIYELSPLEEKMLNKR